MGFKTISTLVLLIVSFYLENVKADYACENGEVLPTSPIQSCRLPGEVILAAGCGQGFACNDDGESGCFLECPQDQYIAVNFGAETWACVPDGPSKPQVCENGLNYLPRNNPFGTCNCEGEIWITEDCHSGFRCTDDVTDEGELVDCGENAILVYNRTTDTWSCSVDSSQCLGVPPFGYGCNQPECETFAQNTLGSCECDEQFFLSDDCKSGFYCQKNIPDPFLYDGCFKECGPGEILRPDWAHRRLDCVNETTEGYTCPGATNLECPNNPVEASEEFCECDNGQYVITSDCSEAFYCVNLLPGGGRRTVCPTGQIIELNLEFWTVDCVNDTGNCPGLGGFKVGCHLGSPTPPPHPGCEPSMNNNFDPCDFDGQLYINGDCTMGFQCDPTIGDGMEGCTRTCNEDSILVPDFSTGTATCVGNWGGLRQCPGAFETSSEELGPDFNYDDDCRCNGEILVNGNCTSGFWCIEGIPNDGLSQECTDGKILSFNFLLQTVECVEDNGQCPGYGGYRIGCGVDEPTLPPPLECSDENAVYSPSNPLGTCACEGHLYVNQGCTEGFYCQEGNDSQRGCYISCPEGTVLITTFETHEWQCVSENSATAYCPPFGFDVCPSNETASTPAPIGTSIPNPLGDCHCDGELWVSEGCSYGFFCDESMANGGKYLACPEGETIEIDFENSDWKCSDLAFCPGEVLGLGCENFDCELAKNNLGTCECDGQFFINSDCSQGFYCTHNIDYEYIYDGCSQKCLNNQILVPSFENNTWECRENNILIEICRGEAKSVCPQNAILNPVDSSHCDCDNQLVVSEDCQTGMYCQDRFPLGGVPMTCDPGYVIQFQPRTWNWRCEEDRGQCPKHGGFKLGCADGGPSPPPIDIGCAFSKNPYPEGCECHGEFFVRNECRESFYCTPFVDDPNTEDGCMLKCDEGQQVYISFADAEWYCREDFQTYCPGDFNTDCVNNFDVNCNCGNEVWINGDCNIGFMCNNQNLGQGNEGEVITCPPGEVISVNFQNPGEFSCVRDFGQCFGSYHFGCNGGDWQDANVTTVPPRIDCDNEYSTYLSYNPIGTCACEDHLWVNDGCTEGFYCGLEGSQVGCDIRCPQGTILKTNFQSNQWECIDENDPAAYCPPYGYDICPSNEAVEPPAPANSSIPNPLGQCHCNGELWVAEGCRFGFFCDDATANGGKYLACDNEQETISINFQTNEWECTSTGTCPGGPILGIGCQDLECVYANNNLGECGCDGQFFINGDCTQGFLCTVDIPDPYLYEGCYQKCLDNQILVPSFANNSWECREKDPTIERCIGEFNLNCPADAIQGPLSSSDCTCDGEYIVTDDCKEMFLCLLGQDDGGISVVCDNENEVVTINPRTYNFRCDTDRGQCPGLGGFRLGCNTGNPPVPDLECSFSANPYPDEQCGCQGEIIIRNNCTESFYCTGIVDDPQTQDGCMLKCDNGERVQFDYLTFEWSCQNRDDVVCPGDFNLDCANTFDVQCNCRNEVWISGDCNQAYFCEAENTDGGPNEGLLIDCPAGTIVSVDFSVPGEYSCVPDQGQCPGSYHFGCGGDWENVDITTASTTTSSTTTGSTTTSTTTTGSTTTSTTTTGSTTSTTTTATTTSPISTTTTQYSPTTTTSTTTTTTTTTTTSSSKNVETTIISFAISFILAMLYI